MLCVFNLTRWYPAQAREFDNLDINIHVIQLNHIEFVHFYGLRPSSYRIISTAKISKLSEHGRQKIVLFEYFKVNCLLFVINILKQEYIFPCVNNHLRNCNQYELTKSNANEHVVNRITEMTGFTKMTPEITGMTLNLQTWHMFIEKLLLPQIFLLYPLTSLFWTLN